MVDISGPVEYLLDIPHEKYRHMEGVNSHGLGLARRSLLKYKYDLEHIEDWKDTESYKIGRAVHTLLLEPRKFLTRYTVIPADARKPSWNKRRENYTPEEEIFATYLEIAEKQHKELLTWEQGNLIEAITSQVSQDKHVVDLLNGADTEVTIRWIERGCWCKARPDAVNVAAKTLIDLKTTTSAHPEDFQKSIFQYGYIYQLAWYKRALSASNIDIKDCIIIAVEKEAPYDYALYRLHNDELELADKSNMQILDSIRDAKNNNNFPGYPKGIRNIRVSEWARNVLEGDRSDDNA